MTTTRILQASIFVTVVAILLFPQGIFAAVPSGDRDVPDALVDELVSTPDFGVVYVADGAGDGTVLNDKPATAVRKIVNLRDAAIPLLIRHLDDTRVTSAKYKGGQYWDNPATVPVGYVCLDILSQIVNDNKVLFVQGRRDCDFDGMGACIQSKYYFSPDEYAVRNNRRFATAKVLAVKHNWETARQAGLLKFRFPSWLARFSAAYSMN